MDDPNNHIDQFILQLLSANDEKAMDVLYHQYAAPVFHIALGILEDTTLADEIRQEVIINIWEKRHHLKMSAPLLPYLKKATTNRCLNFLRDQKKKEDRANINKMLNIRAYQNPEVISHMESKDLRKIIRQTKRNLPPKTKVVFILSRSMKMSYPEIANYLGISVKAVEKHISKALKVFRKIIKDYFLYLPALSSIMYENLIDCAFSEVGWQTFLVC